MAGVLGPDTASGDLDDLAVDTGEFLSADTGSTQTGAVQSLTLGGDTGHDTIAGHGSAPPALSPGEQLGEFRVERPLGSGGMGQVFAVRRAGSPGELVALKYLERTRPAMLYRFKREFRTLAGVTHENLVALGELVANPSLGTFFTMELIDGVPFDQYVRGRTPIGELPNLARLRRAMRQLVAGVRHLHLHDCVHRDLKPSNVLVTAEGRVVILDFGLVSDSSEELGDRSEQQILGTPAYMSPEQAGLERAGPPADWYSVGVMLFECLTGKRPFRGTLTHLLFAKREFEAPKVDELVPEVPNDLALLCRQLLAREPGDRPRGRSIAEALGGSNPDTGLSGGLDDDGETGGARSRGRFFGRERELSLLAEALVDIGGGEAEPGPGPTSGHNSGPGQGPGPSTRQVTVHVRGRSGYGKSALIAEFLAGVRERGDVLMFRGRCFERESVPYKGLDPIVDALSVHLRGMPANALAGLVPAYPAALVRLFPVLDELWTPSAGASGKTGGLDVHELRQRAFAALRELLGKLAANRPLVLHIDDFQWANPDSARLLTELLRPPNAPPMLVIVGYRDEVDGNETLTALTSVEAVAGRDVRELSLGPLSQADARDLAIALMGDEPDPAKAEAYAARAEGSPFYVGQMVRGSGEGATPGQLDQIVVRRILQLDPASRRLLEVLAVAAGPIDSEAAFAAVELDDPEALVPALREAELLRVRLGGSNSLGLTLETAHDRIREVTVGELELADLRATHLRLAVALEAHGSEPEALAEHFERGGDRAKAALYYRSAAIQAGNSLAFARAAALFRTTLELLPEDSDPNELAAVRRGLADQLINIGRGHEAAQLLLALAEWHEQPHRAQHAEARELRRQAADQLIKTGHVDEGLRELDALLRTVGLRLPSGTAAAVSALVWEQARQRVRGFDFVERPASEVPTALLDQIDTCFAVVNGLSTQETLLSALFHFRNLRLALAAGEPSRIARALAFQCVIDVAGRDWQRVDHQFATARRLAGAVDDPQLLGFIDLCHASVQWFERRFLHSSVRHIKLIDSLEGVAGAAWDRRTAHVHHMWTLLSQGQLTEFWIRAKGVSERARERGDMQEMVEVASFSAIALVLAGAPHEARRVLAAAQSEWNPGRYLFGDVWACFGWVNILIHEGEPETAVARAREAVAQMKRTFLDQSAPARRNAQEHMVRALVATAVERDDVRYAKRARRLAAKLRAEHNDVLTANMAVAEAGLASVAGDRAATLARWSEAVTLFEAHGMAGPVAAIAARMAVVHGDTDEGRSWARRAAAYFEREGIEDVDGYCRVLAPANMTRLTTTL